MNVNGEDLSLPEIDLRLAGMSFLCQPHVFFMAMPPIDPNRDGVVLSDKRAKAKRHTWLTAGTTIAAGSDTDLKPGDHVLVNPQFAKRVQGLRSGFFECRSEVWMFGITAPEVRNCIKVEPEDTIFGVVGSQPMEEQPLPSFPEFPRLSLDGLDSSKVIGDIRRFRGRVTLEGRCRVFLLDKFETRGGLVLPDNLHDRADVGIVEGVSPECTFAKPGMLVIYMRRGIDNLYPAGDKQHAYLPERAIYAACLPPARKPAPLTVSV